MINPNDSGHERGGRRVFSPYAVIIVSVSLTALVATFILENSALDETAKISGFAGIIVVFLIACTVLFLYQSRRNRKTDNPASVDIETGLAALDEASAFFSGSLKSADAFRLVSSRVSDLIRYESIVLFLLNETRTQLVAVHSGGVVSGSHHENTANFDIGLADQAYERKQVEIDSYLVLDTTQEHGSSAAIPLFHGENVFGVLQLFFDKDYDVLAADASLFEAVGTRVAPLMLGSIAFERSQANALTDTTTDLPNERAFYMILENQIAESQRKREDRPLTVLAIDIKNFEEINQRFGHAAGDHVLNFVAQVVKDNLRQMDFLARSINDEFLAVLPTASQEVSHDVIARIHTGFFGRKLRISDHDSIEVELNVGWAAFGNDGETPARLLSLAQLRKEQSKSIEPNKILWFPQEIVN